MRCCPNCNIQTKRSVRRYSLTGLVNTPVYICEGCNCWFIECDLGGNNWGTRTILIEGKKESEKILICDMLLRKDEA